MAKSHWQKHCAAFSKQADQSAAARNAYCEKNQLNPNSFRREFAAYKNSGAEPETKPEKEPKKVRPVKGESSKKNDEPRTDAQKPKAGKGRAGSTRVPRINISVKTAAGRPHPNVVTRPDGTRTFTQGNTASVKHGAYSRLMTDLDLECDPSEFSLADLGQVAKSRVLGMARIRQAKLNAVERLYDEGKKMTRPVMTPDGIVNEPMTLLEAIEDIEYSGIEPLTRLVALAVQVEEKTISMEKMRRDMAHLSRGEIVEMTASILQRRALEELSATDTCRLFAESGIEPPKFLQAESDKEIKKATPPPPEDGGLTNEQIEEARRKAIERKNASQGELSERQEWLDTTLAATGQVGDVRVTESVTDDDISLMDDDTGIMGDVDIDPADFE